ncbi:MAG: UxaA family hydrolase [Rhizobiaceae bacterium]|nr:UxaA family hydrolase [Rhizobiaceae bacterium]
MGEPLPTSDNDPRLLLLSDHDNVLVAREDIAEGQAVLIAGLPVVLGKAIARGHKVARRPIAAGAKIMKYGAPIGSATQAIAPGDHVHLHNVKSDYTPTHVIEISEKVKTP